LKFAPLLGALLAFYLIALSVRYSAGVNSLSDLPLIYQPHHDGSLLYVPNQNPQLGDMVTVRLRVPAQASVTTVVVRTIENGEMRLTPAHIQRVDGNDTWWEARLHLVNSVLPYRFRLDGGPTGVRWLNGAGLWNRTIPDDADFRLNTFPKPPTWVSDAVVYQIFPDRFATTGKYSTPVPDWAIAQKWDDAVVDVHDIVGRQFYGGDLDGVTEHLDHIQQLGANLIYLTPIFPGWSNHRYNASSFDEVDALLGGNEALTRLCSAAHARGIRVIGDFTSNHTGNTHEWFLRAAADPNAPEREYYYWKPDGSYVSWFDVPTLPKLNHTSHNLRHHLFEDPNGPVRKWIAAGLDGWRVDVANMTGREGTDDLNHAVARQLRHAATSVKADALVVAEHYFDYSPDLQGDGWHGVMNYSGFTFPVWSWLHDPANALPYLHGIVETPHLDGQLMAATMRDFNARVPWQNLVASFNLLDSHDTARIATLLDSDAALTEVAVTLMATLPSMPMIEYGDEIGMHGLTGEDGRRPMPWNRSLWHEDVLQAYQKLLTVRRTLDALRHGGLRWIYTGADAVVFLREATAQTVLVYVARTAHGTVHLPLDELAGWAASIGHPVHQAGKPQVVADSRGVDITSDGPAVSVWAW
jgi:alpha-glucosidase